MFWIYLSLIVFKEKNNSNAFSFRSYTGKRHVRGWAPQVLHCTRKPALVSWAPCVLCSGFGSSPCMTKRGIPKCRVMRGKLASIRRTPCKMEFPSCAVETEDSAYLMKGSLTFNSPLFVINSLQIYFLLLPFVLFRHFCQHPYISPCL